MVLKLLIRAVDFCIDKFLFIEMSFFINFASTIIFSGAKFLLCSRICSSGGSMTLA